ncbi:hypothetical protein GPLA_2817 [Paraglaciecola polaris LMG 21857]|uniref:Uncharacterized protein n=1 Tax=Paraglaciecola polaris LMG 21857 TaxID=1129793 RepID=K6ZC84_9ALTE|nr:hypothetical protein GPLA_2817 [Paraglaciecola polaris LMG 21857]
MSDGQNVERKKNTITDGFHKILIRYSVRNDEYSDKRYNDLFSWITGW